MSFSDLVQAAKATAILEKISPNEESVYRNACREYSKRFHVSLKEVLEMNPYNVYLDLFGDQMSGYNLEDIDNINDLLDQLYSIKDPDYDIEQEKAFRKELSEIEEDEERRLALGEAIHPVLEPKNKPPEESPAKEMPKTGGLNMDLIKQLQNDGETGEF